MNLHGFTSPLTAGALIVALTVLVLVVVHGLEHHRAGR